MMPTAGTWFRSSVLGALAFIGCAATGSLLAAQELRDVTLQDPLAFTGWGKVADPVTPSGLSFRGWGAIADMPAPKALTFAGWGGTVSAGPITLSFAGWNERAAAGPVTVTFEGVKDLPPPCHPRDIAAGVPAAPPRVGGNGHLYQIFTCQVDWPTAVSACAAAGANLVTIGSAGEQDLVAALGTRCPGAGCWIGASDAATEGRFEWVTGEPLGFTNWAGGEPNDHCDGEDFVHIGRSGEWNDQEADGGCNGWGLMGFVCEWPR